MPTARKSLATAALEEYNPATNSWNRRLYAIGGYGGLYSEYLGTVEEYDPVIDIWRTRAEMQTPRIWFATVAVDERLYALGGFSFEKGNIATVEEYNPPAFVDTDGDRLADYDETNRYGTDPLVPDADADTDTDGISNVAEIDTYNTDPNLRDTDGDGLDDGEEVNAGTDPNDPKDSLTPTTITSSVPEFEDVQIISIIPLLFWLHRKSLRG
jgi:hypothetical protein